LVWPAAENALSSRLGYTTSGTAYLPAERANGATVWIDSGSATLYAGYPEGGSHRALATLSNGNFFDVSGLEPGEVLSVQSGAAFGYQIDMPPPPEPEVPTGGGTLAPNVTWTCTSSPCPWGSSASAYAVAWPPGSDATSARFGYTVSKPVYLPSSRANGASIEVLAGTALLYAGFPDATNHRVLATLVSGNSYEVSGLLPGEMLSVQSVTGFIYEVTVPPAPPPPPVQGVSSELVTWSCTSSPCPWGSLVSGHAGVWPNEAATAERLGYTTSRDIYLPSYLGNGARVTLREGSASLYAGTPGAPSHRVVASLAVGISYDVAGLSLGEVLSLQGGAAFRFDVVLPNAQPPPPPPANAINSVTAFWRCDIEDCTSEDWVGQVINWPSWAAYPNNNRSGTMSRTVYSSNGGLLYPYMGSWANGCQVTAHSGTVLIIEWERGTDEWREIWLEPGQSHVISLHAPEDGAMIESNGDPFSVSLANCTPQPL
jgi:hypothetical protein